MRKIAILPLCLFAAVTLAAQNPISNQVEVTRDFSPSTESAEKLTISPSMVDHVNIDMVSDIKYSITPTPWQSIFGTKPINPVKISTFAYEPRTPFYLRVGGAYNLRTLLDFYYTADTKPDAVFGVYVNHVADLAKVSNDMNEKLPSLSMRNNVGLYAEKLFAKKILTVDAYAENRWHKPYGAFELASNPLSNYYASGADINRTGVSAEVVFGDRFVDLSYFNYRIGVSGGYFLDNNKYSQAEVEGFVDLGWKIDRGDLNIGIKVRDVIGIGNLSDYNDLRVSVLPKYTFKYKDFSFVAGFEFLYNQTYLNEPEFRFYPEVKVAYTGYSPVTPYLTFDGGLSEGDYMALSQANAYVQDGAVAPNASRLGFRIGGNGKVSSILKYDAFVGCDFWRDYTYFANVYEEGNTTRFVPLTSRAVNMFYVGAEAKVKIINGLYYDLNLRYNLVSRVKAAGAIGSVTEAGIDVPVFQLNTGFRYSYRDKVFAYAGIDLAGRREVCSVIPVGVGQYEYVSEKLPLTIDLKAGVEVKTLKWLNLFLEGNNLLNQRIYKVNHYPGIGLCVMVGAKMVF